MNESSLLFSTKIADYPSERDVYPHRFREYVSRPSSSCTCCPSYLLGAKRNGILDRKGGSESDVRLK